MYDDGTDSEEIEEIEEIETLERAIVGLDSVADQTKMNSKSLYNRKDPNDYEVPKNDEADLYEKDHFAGLYNEVLTYTKKVSVPIFDVCSYIQFERMLSKYQ